jgi:predicted NBD/HSP70 family sugar kinase
MELKNRAIKDMAAALAHAAELLPDDVVVMNGAAVGQWLLEQPVQDTEAFLHWYDNAHWGNEDFKEGCRRSWNAAIEHTTPPAQPAAWVGLTDEEMVELFERYGHKTAALLDAHEAKLREKNGGTP